MASLQRASQPEGAHVAGAIGAVAVVPARQSARHDDENDENRSSPQRPPPGGGESRKTASKSWFKRRRKRAWHVEQQLAPPPPPAAPTTIEASLPPSQRPRHAAGAASPAASRCEPRASAEIVKAEPERLAAERHARIGAEALLAGRTEALVASMRDAFLRERTSVLVQPLVEQQHYLVGVHSGVVLAVPHDMGELDADRLFGLFMQQQNRSDEVRCPPARSRTIALPLASAYSL
jgi:hypothetical protein